MTLRFRVSDHAFLQQKTLQVPMCLLEAWVQPYLRGASALLSTRDLARFSAELRKIARPFLGLYVVADGRGTITHIAKMSHRLSVAEQEHLADVADGIIVEATTGENVEVLAMGGLY